LVYWNAQETVFRLTPGHVFTLPLGVLMLAATIAGALLMFVVALWREGRHALREWRVHREMRAAQRSVEATAQARSLALAGEFSRARALLKRATQKRSAEAADVIDYADTFMLEGDPAQARTILEEGQRTFGNDAMLLYALANACAASGDARTAIATLERALAIHAKSPRLLTLLRDQLFEVGDWQRATAIQARIVELNPTNEAEANRMLGARYEATLRAPETERGVLLKTLCHQAPDFVPATIERARSLARTGEQRRALKLLERALAAKPRSVLLDLYEEIARTDDVSRVNKLYSKLMALHPDSVDLKLRAAAAAISRHRLDEAAALLSSCSSNGGAPAAQILWAQLHDARNQPDLAHAAYREAAASGSLGKPGFACEKCGSMSESWRARCNNCDTWGFVEDVHQ
jgi:HemY protein